jgi:hypothetical protein
MDGPTIDIDQSNELVRVPGTFVAGLVIRNIYREISCVCLMSHFEIPDFEFEFRNKESSLAAPALRKTNILLLCMFFFSSFS